MAEKVQKEIILKVLDTLNESQARWFIAMLAMMLGHGGIKKMYELTSLSRPTIIKGIKELKTKEKLADGEKVRCSGGGRKRIEERNPKISNVLKHIMDETTAGDPMSLLKWTSKSIYQISDQMQTLGHSISKDTVHRRLKEMGYSLQANVKVKEGGNHKDRDRQFRYISNLGKEFMRKRDPVISVDAKKKERIGDFKNPGKKWHPKGSPQEVNVYDFPSLSKGTAIPYGTYDIQKNNGIVNVGISHETAEFAVESIRKWWRQFGHQQYPHAKRILISADGGGSNGSRNRAWKFYLQLLSDEISLPITVCHYPPGTSKWNKIEHRMFSFISMNWRGQPLVSYETVVNMISATTTKSGLKIKAFLDRNDYKTGIKISDKQIKKLNIKQHKLHPQWNYTIIPRAKS
ncbi:MAG: hypothetical protein DDT32_01693 [Syntrophomonadaceae bacterium]|nr:hypothetical protein [Bacillota bacterium]